MPEKKKQHYVPQFYLNLFSKSNKEFAVFNINNKTAHHPIPCKSQCYKNYYYGDDGLWEERLSNMENEWSEIIKKICLHTVLDKYQIKLIKQFALYQRQRTLAEGEYSEKARIETLMELGKFFCDTRGCNFDDSMKSLCLERASEKITPAENLQMAEKFVDSIEDLQLLVIEYKTKARLISSDAPVVAINPFSKQTTGYYCMGLILLFPISSHQMVVIYDAKMYTRFRNNMYVSISNENEVLRLNALQLISAEKILFAESQSDFSGFTLKDWEARNNSRNIGPIQTLGCPTKPLIYHTMRKILYNGDFTFAQMSNRFRMIPYPCREAVPRQFDEKWEEKLNTKSTIISQILSRQPYLLKDMGVTLKQYRKGCEQMYKAAKFYWSLN